MRKTRDVLIGPEGKRDAGKLFVVTEMSAQDAYKWGRDGIRALAGAGLDVLPDEMEGASLALIAAMGFKALASAPVAELDSLMARLDACAAYIPDASRRDLVRPIDGMGVVEEYPTIMRLQKEAFELSLGFSLPALTAPSPATGPTTAG